MTINKSSIQDHIIKGNTRKAIDALLILCKKHDTNMYNNIIILSNRYNTLIKDINYNNISEEEGSIRINRINYALINELEDVKEDWTTDKTENKTPPLNKTILFLAANPKTTTRLRLGEEIRAIENSLKRDEKFQLIQKWAVRITDLRQALLDEKPYIIHFSGHGSEHNQIILEDEIGNGKEIPVKAIGNLFSLFQDTIKCVILNACYSEIQAQEIAQYIPYVIGMNDAIPDKAAIAFSSAFYDAINSGKDFEFAFKYAQFTIELYDIGADNIPILIKK